MRRRGIRLMSLIAALFTIFLWGGITADPSVTATITYINMDYPYADLGTFGGWYSEAVAINNRGQVVGQSAIAGDSAVHTFLYSKGMMTDLFQTVSDVFLVHGFRVDNITNAGEIVGIAENRRAYVLTIPNN